MKQINYWLSLGCLTVMTACASTQAPVTLQAVGPAPQTESHSEKVGYLMVYSAWESNANINRHSAYTVASADGKMNRSVKNAMDMFDGGPAKIALSAGTYQVNALATHTGRVIVPVQIEPGQTTSVYLDGYPHLNSTSADQTALVKSPDGAIAGWAAKSGN